MREWRHFAIPSVTRGRGGVASGMVFALSVFAIPSAARAELYSFVDEEGILHLTNVRPNSKYRPYLGEDAEGFGGDRPLVYRYGGGSERVLYPVDVSRYDDLLREAAAQYDLPFAFLKAVAKVESNFNPRAVSPANAKGLMQLIDSTARAMKVEDVFDPKQNVFGGARYLRMLANQFDGHMALTAAAYNAGPERVDKARRIPAIAETERYVQRVLTMYRHYRQAR